jgi:hypothetical protein
MKGGGGDKSRKEGKKTFHSSFFPFLILATAIS